MLGWLTPAQARLGEDFNVIAERHGKPDDFEENARIAKWILGKERHQYIVYFNSSNKSIREVLETQVGFKFSDDQIKEFMDKQESVLRKEPNHKVIKGSAVVSFANRSFLLKENDVAVIYHQQKVMLYASVPNFNSKQILEAVSAEFYTQTTPQKTPEPPKKKPNLIEF